MSQERDITILLVEDDIAFRELLESLLIEEGYEVLVAASGEEALEKAAGANYDLVVTDVKLGGMDGLDTLSELKRGRSELQSLVITGYATEADSIRAISLGVGNYLKKPFSLPDFLRAVNEVAKQILLERDQAEFKQAALETGLWGLEILLKTTLADESERLLNTAMAAERVATNRGLSASASRQIRLAVLAAGQEDSGTISDVPFLLRILPNHTRWLIENINSDIEDKSEDLQIAQHALKMLSGEAEAGDLEAELSDAFAGAGTPPDSDSTQGDVGKYLALAKAMEVSGDIGAASKILEQLEEKDEQVTPQALLYRARVQWMQGDNVNAASLLEQAREACRNLSQRCKISLEGGVLLARVGQLDKAQAWLEDAVNGFDELQNPSEKSRAILASQSVGSDSDSVSIEDLEVLLRPHQLESLLSSAHWLFPYLIKVPEEQTVNRALVRLTRDAPHSVSRCLQNAELSPELRLKALDLIEQVGIDGYDDLLSELMFETDLKLRGKAQKLLENQDSVRVTPVLRVYALGSLSTWLGERRIPDKGWTGSKPFYLLNYLAQQGGQFVSQERLLDIFWNGAAKANKNLNQCLVVMRNALRSPDWPDRIDYVERRGALIGLNEEHRIWHDASLVLEALEKAENYLRDDNRRRASDFFQQALELDRGEYLPTCYDDWAIDFRENLTIKLVKGLSSLAEIRLIQSRPADALPVLERILARDPYHSSALSSRFQAHLDLDQPLEVIKLYEKLETRMRVDLEVEPPLDLVKLYHMAKMRL